MRKNLIKASVLGSLLLASSAFANPADGTYPTTLTTHGGKTARPFSGTCTFGADQLLCAVHTQLNNCSMNLASGFFSNGTAQVTIIGENGSACPFLVGTTGTWGWGWMYPDGSIDAQWGDPVGYLATPIHLAK